MDFINLLEVTIVWISIILMTDLVFQIYIEDVDAMYLIKKNGEKLFIDMPYSKRNILKRFLPVK
ncbi:MAG: hypothetical protein AAB358_01515 [Patescibacteria group bacterium]